MVYSGCEGENATAIPSPDPEVSMHDGFDGIDWSDDAHDDWLWGEISNLFAAFDPDDPEGSRQRISAMDENTLTCIWEAFHEWKPRTVEPCNMLETFNRIAALFR